MKVIQQIIDIVAKDSPTEGIRRLVQMMRSVYACTRKTGESPAIYARRFQSLALDYLNHCDAVAAEQDSQNFAMLLLENAKVPSSVYSTMITQMVASASNPHKTADNTIYVISKNTLHAKLSKANLLLEPEGSSSSPDSAARDMKDLITTAINSNERHSQEDHTSFRVTLDNAVEVLTDIKVDDADAKTGNPKTKSLDSLPGKRRYPEGNERQDEHRPFSRYPRNKGRIPYGQGPKAESNCRACNRPNHWYKDPECLLNVMRSIMQGKDIESDIVAKLPEDARAIFKNAEANKKKVTISDIAEVIGNSPGDHKAQTAKPSNSCFR